MHAKTIEICCEQCSGTTISCCAEWIVFDRLAFCSPDCRTEYQLSIRRRKMMVLAVSGKNGPPKSNPSKSPAKVRGAA